MAVLQLTHTAFLERGGNEGELIEKFYRENGDAILSWLHPASVELKEMDTLSANTSLIIVTDIRAVGDGKFKEMVVKKSSCGNLTDLRDHLNHVKEMFSEHFSSTVMVLDDELERILDLAPTAS